MSYSLGPPLYLSQFLAYLILVSCPSSTLSH